MSLRSSIKTVLTLGRGVALGIPPADESANPIRLFERWFETAKESGLFLPESAALATASADGTPSVRMVLLKGVDEGGFVFYTNYGSRKAREIEENPRAALCFHWPVLERQVRVSGRVTRVSEEESAAYFSKRSRGSRIGAWASRQSEPLPERKLLEARVAELDERFGDGDVPRPEFWGGYRLEAEQIEFWQGRADRLHDRVLFTRCEEEGWRSGRLYP